MAFQKNSLMTEEGKRIRQHLWNKQNNENASEELYWSGSHKHRLTSSYSSMMTTRGRHSIILLGTTLVDDLMFLG